MSTITLELPKGDVAINTDDTTVTDTPNSDFNGDDSFMYQTSGLVLLPAPRRQRGV
jgi:hypothetical protein